MPQPSYSPRLFLYVDDDPNQCSALGRLLREHGEVRFAGSRVEGLAVFNQASFWTAVMADQSMPGGTGFDFLNELRKLDPSVPAAILTVLDDAEVMRLAGEVSAEYLHKPVTPPNLARFCRGAIGLELERWAKRKAAAVARMHHLTPREEEVLSWGLRGLSSARIADVLAISVNTAKTHWRELLLKVSLADHAGRRELLERVSHDQSVW